MLPSTPGTGDKFVKLYACEWDLMSLPGGENSDNEIRQGRGIHANVGGEADEIMDDIVCHWLAATCVFHSTIQMV